MTIILVKCVCICTPNSNRIKIKLETMYICVRGNDFAGVSTILSLDIAAVLTVWYIYLFILAIKSGTLEDLLHTYLTLVNVFC